MRDFIHTQWGLELAENQGIFLEKRIDRTSELEPWLQQRLLGRTSGKEACRLALGVSFQRRKCLDNQSSVSIFVVCCGIVSMCVQDPCFVLPSTDLMQARTTLHHLKTYKDTIFEQGELVSGNSVACISGRYFHICLKLLW